ncbi:TPA: twin-arginine translocase TatA/TatE family subunit [Candidatus Latescibacteria bacterium]|nr:twin-arginine translocase TatA/TatE family subunit [Candidatus Latescibacterota bacterium]
MFQGIGTWEILLIFLVALLLFGAKRIPEIAKGLGKGITEFKRAIKDVKDEIETNVDDAPPSPPPPPANTAPQSQEPEKKVES